MNTPLAFLLTALFGMCAAALDKHPILAFFCTCASFVTMYQGWAAYTAEVRQIRLERIRIVDVGTEWVVYFVGDHNLRNQNSGGIHAEDLPEPMGVDILEQRTALGAHRVLTAIRVKIISEAGKTWLDKANHVAVEHGQMALVRAYRGRAKKAWDSKRV